jgi:hypothetical protein
MKKDLLLLGFGLLALAPAPAATPDDISEPETYQSIVARNPFALKDPPPPPPPAPPPASPKGDILLTGIMSIIPPKRAYLMTREPGGKVHHYNMVESDEIDGIKVMSIDEVARTVKIFESGSEKLLSFETHGIKPPTNAAPARVTAPPGGMPNLPGRGAIPAPNVNAAGRMPVTSGMNSGANPGRSIIPPRTLRVAPTGSDGSLPPPGLVDRYGLNNAQINRSGDRVQVVQHQDAPEAPQRMSAEEQAIMMEIQRQASDIPMPPTPGFAQPMPFQDPNNPQQ